MSKITTEERAQIARAAKLGLTHADESGREREAAIADPETNAIVCRGSASELYRNRYRWKGYAVRLDGPDLDGGDDDRRLMFPISLSMGAFVAWFHRAEADATEQELKAEAAEAELEERSDAYHAHPSHPTDCTAYQAHYGRQCPCESYQPESDLKAGAQ